MNGRPEDHVPFQNIVDQCFQILERFLAVDDKLNIQRIVVEFSVQPFVLGFNGVFQPNSPQSIKGELKFVVAPLHHVQRLIGVF